MMLLWKECFVSIGSSRATTDSYQHKDYARIHFGRKVLECLVHPHQAGDQMTSLKTSIGDVVTEVKDHFQTSMDTAATHNSALLLGVRQDVQSCLRKDSRTDQLQT
eukprot:2182496-Amphidinium_carterae.1